MASVSLWNVPAAKNTTIPQWAGPNPTVIHVHLIPYTSLAAPLAAFITISGKQWLNCCAQVEVHGSTIDRNVPVGDRL